MLYDLGQDGTATPVPGAAPAGADWLTNLVQGFAAVKLANQQANAAAQVNAINIQRAQQGLPPISVDLSGAAPTVAVGLAPGVQSLVQLAIFGVLGLFALSLILKAWK